MHAISDDYFLMEGYDFFRVGFIRGEGGVLKTNEMFDDGRVMMLTKE